MHNQENVGELLARRERQQRALEEVMEVAPAPEDLWEEAPKARRTQQL